MMFAMRFAFNLDISGGINYGHLLICSFNTSMCGMKIHLMAVNQLKGMFQKCSHSQKEQMLPLVRTETRSRPSYLEHKENELMWW